MTLSCSDRTLTEIQQIQLFTTGLGEPLRTDVALQWSCTMDKTVMFAGAYEQRLLVAATHVLAPSKSTGRAGPKPLSVAITLSAARTLATSPSASSVKPLPSRRLTPAEIADRHKKNQCYHYNDSFTPKHLFVIEVVGDDEAPLLDEPSEPMISIHSLMGNPATFWEDHATSSHGQWNTTLGLLDSG
jgi:hypothetical protein